jgi:outer membrane receptor protein involved in Fe transport
MLTRWPLFPALLMAVAAEPALAADPEISFVHEPAPSCRAGEPLVVEGHMLGASEVESAELYYRTARTRGWRTLEVELVQGDQYRVELPADDIREPTVEYYVVAVDFLENRIPALGSEAQPITITVLPGATGDTGEVIKLPPDGAQKPEPPAPPPDRGTQPPPAMISTPAPAVGRAASLGDFAAFGTSTILEAAQIETLTARTLLDVLLAIPEVDISYDVSGFARVALRGMNADGDVLLTVDGQVLNNEWDGRAFWALPADMVSRVEVRRGPAAGLGLEGHLAGVIAVTTRTGEARLFLLSAGTHASHLADESAKRGLAYDVATHGGLRLSPLLISGFAAVTVSEGTQATVRTDAYSSPASVSEAPGPMKDRGLRFAAGGELFLSDLLPGELTLQARLAFERRGAGIGFVDTYGPSSELDWYVGLLQLKHRLVLDAGLELHSRIALDLQATARHFQLTPRGFTLSDRNGDGNPERFADGVIEEARVTTFGIAADLGADWRLMGGHTLRGGVLVSRRQAELPGLKRNIDSTGAAQALTTVYTGPAGGALARTLVSARLEDDWAAHAKVDFTLGLRFSWLSDLPAIDVAKMLNPQVGVIYRPIDTVAIKMLYGSTFRPPTFAERSERSAASLPSALAEDRLVGNPQLVAAAAHTIETGAEYNGTLGGLGYAARLDGSYSRFVDSIERLAGASLTDPESQRVLVSQRARIDAFSANVEGRVEFANRSYLYVGGWWYRLQDGEPALGVTLLTSTPQQGAVLGVNLELGDVGELNLGARYGAERRNNVRTVLERLRSYRLPAYLLASATARTRLLWDTCRFGLSAHNLFDVDIRDPVPRPDLMPDQMANEGLALMFTVEVVP